MSVARPKDARVRGAGMLLGIGMGGFVDGIVLHQIVQLHAMFSARLPLDTIANMRANMVGDGLFHAAVWLATLAGIALLWRALTGEGMPPHPRVLAGAMLAGWGAFNLVEGLVDHHLLGLHHVVERLGLSVWDRLFLLSGVVLIAVGALIARTRTAPRPGPGG